MKRNNILSIFSIPKAFIGHIGVIQRNAIRSWISLGESVEVLLLGDDPGVANVAHEFNLVHIPSLQRNRFNTPTVSSAFQLAQKAAKGSFMAYVNGDIILTHDILKALKSISFDKFLLSCQRVDLDVTEELDFAEVDWETKLRYRAATSGKPLGPAGMDCFIFPKGMYQNLPPFGIGRAGWDNWLIYWSRSQKIPVIDATGLVTLFHQNHDYSHHPKGLAGVHGGPERDWNIELAGGWDHIFTLEEANWLLSVEGLKKPLFTRKMVLNRIRRLPALHPRSTPFVQLFLFLCGKMKWAVDLCKVILSILKS